MRLYGLIGYPLSHSFSAQYFEKKFTRERITNAVYRHFQLKKCYNILPLIQDKPDLAGLNVTSPYKVSVLPYLNSFSEEAYQIGAVNCIKILRDPSGYLLIGYNTDVYGFRKTLVSQLKPHHTHAIVLGTGGAARAVCFTLKKLGINYVMVSRETVGNSIIPYQQLNNQLFHTHTLVINTTPVGMFPDVDACPDIPYHDLTEKHFLYDLIYNPVETEFIRKGREAGATTMNGLRMLELQAEKSWEIWNE